MRVTFMEIKQRSINLKLVITQVGTTFVKETYQKIL